MTHERPPFPDLSKVRRVPIYDGPARKITDAPDFQTDPRGIAAALARQRTEEDDDGR
jgi:hypothetical protein